MNTFVVKWNDGNKYKTETAGDLLFRFILELEKEDICVQQIVPTRTHNGVLIEAILICTIRES